MRRAIPVLTYHHVNEHEGNLVTVSPRLFEQQIAALTHRGYTFLTAQEFTAILRGERECPRRPVLLTFDDGYLDTWVHAYPILKLYEARASLFLVTSWVADTTALHPVTAPLPTHSATHEALRRQGAQAECALTWGEIEAMARDGVVDVQSHTHSHFRCRVSRENRDAVAKDLAVSREQIEIRLGTECRHLSWPWGEYNGEAVRLARSLGYEGLFTTRRGVNAVPEDLSAVRRLDVKAKGSAWLLSRVALYSRPLLGRLYARLRGER